MNDLNRVTIIGRLTRDCEIKQTSGGLTVCSFTIAVNGKKKQGEQWVDEANFFDCVGFGKLYDAIGQYLTKGKQVAIAGQLKQDRWENKDGQKRSKVGIKVDDIQLMAGKTSSTAQSDEPNFPQPAQEDEKSGGAGDIPF